MADPETDGPRPAPATAAARTGRGRRSPGEVPGTASAEAPGEAGTTEPAEAEGEASPVVGPAEVDGEEAPDGTGPVEVRGEASPVVGPAEVDGEEAPDGTGPVEVRGEGSPAGSVEGVRSAAVAGTTEVEGEAAESGTDGPTEIAVTSRTRAWWGMAAIVLREWAIVIGLLGLGAAIGSFGERVVAGGLTPGEVLTLLLAPLAYALLLAIQGGVLVAVVVVAVLAPAGLRLSRPAFLATAVGAWVVGAAVTLALFGTTPLPLLATAVGALLHLGTLLWRFRRQDREAAAAGEG